MATRTRPLPGQGRMDVLTSAGSGSATGMPMDLFRRGNDFVVLMELPGADPDSIDVSVDDRMLTVRGHRRMPAEPVTEWLVRERPSGSFARQFTLGRGLATDAIAARYTDGVLRLTIPVSAGATPRRIEVNSSTPQESIGTSNTAPGQAAAARSEDAHTVNA